MQADSQDPQNPQSVVSVDDSDEDDSVVQVNVQISSGVTLDPEGLSSRSSISDSNEVGDMGRSMSRNCASRVKQLRMRASAVTISGMH